MAFSDWFYGMDLASSTPFPCEGNGANFYIGLIGGETSLRSGYFNETAATTVGTTHTFAIWDLAGPNSTQKPSGMGAEEWGVKQGEAFTAALSSSPYAKYIGGRTYFADIESGNGGWDSDNEDNNTATLFGFLDVMYGGGPNTAGVYISPSNWNTYFGSSYTSQIPIVVWAAGSNCPSSCADAATEFNSTYADMTIGGYKVMIWQYSPSGCNGSRDLDITPYTGYQSGQWHPTT